MGEIPDKIMVFGIDHPDDTGEDVSIDDRHIFSRNREDMEMGRGAVEPDELRDRLGRFLNGMQHVLSGLPEQFGELRLDSVSISAEISAKGSVSLLGVGTEIAGKGGITFTLQRPGMTDNGAGAPASG
jgi:hypothetical protein